MPKHMRSPSPPPEATRTRNVPDHFRPSNPTDTPGGAKPPLNATDHRNSADGASTAIQELLTVDEFADRMKVGRSTVFEWKTKGRLQAGKHYIRIEKTLRFLWPLAVVVLMSEEPPTLNTGDETGGAATTQERLVPQRPVGVRTGVRRSAVNLDY